MTASVLGLLLDEQTARHAVAALTEHAVTMRQCGLPLPDGYADLLRLLTSAASRRQETTSLDELDGQGDGAPMTERLLTYALAAPLLGLSERQVQRLVGSGDLPSVNPTPGATRIRLTDVQAFIANLPVRTHTDSRSTAA